MTDNPNTRPYDPNEHVAELHARMLLMQAQIDRQRDVIWKIQQARHALAEAVEIAGVK